MNGESWLALKESKFSEFKRLEYVSGGANHAEHTVRAASVSPNAKADASHKDACLTASSYLS